MLGYYKYNNTIKKKKNPNVLRKTVDERVYQGL